MTNASEVRPSAGLVEMSGAITIAAAVAAMRTSGASGRTALECEAWMRSLAASFRRSSRGWRTGAPARPSALARTFAMKPYRSGPPVTAAPSWMTDTPAMASSEALMRAPQARR